MSARAPKRRWASWSSKAGSVAVTWSPDHSARIAPIADRTVARLAGRFPSARSGRSPVPIPRIIRPSEISSTVAAATAVMAGWRESGLVTAVPSNSRGDAIAASERYAYELRACSEESVSQRFA